ncbi:MAG: hypothetical protein HQK56_16250 [Deltaproteobacteria bacterium]|nr:hypothetical protein [Deltaproteobacteria bacterium]
MDEKVLDKVGVNLGHLVIRKIHDDSILPGVQTQELNLFAYEDDFLSDAGRAKIVTITEPGEVILPFGIRDKGRGAVRRFRVGNFSGGQLSTERGGSEGESPKADGKAILGGDICQGKIQIFTEILETFFGDPVNLLVCISLCFMLGFINRYKSPGRI